MKKIACVVGMLFYLSFIMAAPKASKYAMDKKDREIKAYRIPKGVEVKIDGNLNEKIWKNPGYTDFVQSDPIDGAIPTEKTVVWIAYDDKALYVAARMFDSQPEKIVRRLGRRDSHVDSDWFTFAIDPYFDRRSGFLFSVNPAGSIMDAVLYNDTGRDYSWDGVWEWAAKVDDKGWTVEMKIPFNQLRFQKKDKYIWGVNFTRFIMRKQELDTFVWIPKGETAFVSRFARLKGIEGINPGLFVELLPYAVADVTLSPEEPGNPFKTGVSCYKNAGIDLKLGLKSNLTLSATINPDFGQVEVDPAVINLSAYETFYEEKRPFFIEGSSIFRFGKGGVSMENNINWDPPMFFYSRRIGRPPQGRVSTEGYVKYPDRTTIISAAKITGKVGNGWNIGLISAFTAREYAEIAVDEERRLEEVEPFTGYSVLRIQKEFNGGKQGLGIIGTSVFRDLKKEELREILPEKALALGIDGWTFLDDKRNWVLSGWLGFSLVEGSKDAILRLQYSPQHYFQRPDATHVEVDENATSLRGWAGRIILNKERGNFIVNASIGAVSPGFEVNDLGYQRGGDLINGHLFFGYVWYHPGKIFRYKVIAAGVQKNYDFGGNGLEGGFFFMGEGQLLNYWGGRILIGIGPRTLDKNLTRGGPLALQPSFTFVNLGIYSDARKALVLYLGMTGVFTEYDEKQLSAFSNLKWKVRSNLSISLGPSYSYRHAIAQWVTCVEDEYMQATYGKRYVFGDIYQKTIASSIRINWTFTPKLSLQAYLQPFIAVGKYDRFKELARPRSYEFNVYGENGSTIKERDGFYEVDPDGTGPAPSFYIPNPDFNYKSLRGTVVLRWEYLPGSTLYLVWTQNRADFSYPGDFNFRRDFMDMLTAPGDNIFLIKITYRWGY